MTQTFRKIARRIAAPLVDFNFEYDLEVEDSDKWKELFAAFKPNIVLYRSPSIYFNRIDNPYDLRSLEQEIVDQGYYGKGQGHKILKSDPIIEETMKDFKSYYRDDAINVFYTAHSNPKNLGIGITTAEWFAHDLGHLALMWENITKEHIENVRKIADRYITVDTRSFEPHPMNIGLNAICAWIDPSQHPVGAAFSKNVPEDFLGDLIFDFVIDYVKNSGKMPTEIRIDPFPLYLTTHQSKLMVAAKPDGSTYGTLRPQPGLKPELERAFNEFLSDFSSVLDRFFDQHKGKILIFN